MADEIDIRDFEDSLLITTKRRTSVATSALSILVPPVLVIIALGRFVQTSILIVAALAASGLAIAQIFRKREVQLSVTKQGFDSRGYVGNEFCLRRRLARDDVQWLEYQEDATGPETSHHPRGLYAVLKNRSVCLLPDLSEQQTQDLIEQIARKFPDLGKDWKSRTAFGANFTTLGL